MRAALVASLLLCGTLAHAQGLPPAEFEGGDEPVETAAPESVPASGVTLGRYLDALSSARLIAEETGSDRRLQDLIRRGESLYFDGRHDEAALILYEVAESPRFRDFSTLDEYSSAELMLASSLAELGSLRSASRYLERILRRGPENPYFAPAYRRFVDVALQSGDLTAGIQILTTLEAELPEDAENELRYLRGRREYDSGNLDIADDIFEEITRRSRFFANAQYFRGVVAARDGDLGAAEERFCSIATTDDQERFTFYVDDRFFQVKDLAWLALGRVAHEGARSDDAFYYYFQVPNDSERVAEALFEAAFAMYEGDDYDTAVDLLDQLEARFPASPFVDEAMLLRGYVHLGRCEFEEASQLFVRFAERFGPLVSQIDAILESETRQRNLYRDLLDEERRQSRLRDRQQNEGLSEDDAAEEQRQTLSTLQGLMLALLRVDPTFYELHRSVATLDAEAARAGRMAEDLRGLAARMGGSDSPQAAAERERFDTETDQLRTELTTAREVLASMARQLDTLRRGGASAEQIRPLETELRAFTERVETLGERVAEAIAAGADLADVPEVEATDVRELFREDAQTARRLPARVRDMRTRLIAEANAAAMRSLRTLRARLGGALRRSRIGRIDAVMGSKRRIEIQIESLAAGRFPPELVDPLRIQGLLRDDEEYWPFEGEFWSDEFDETIPLDELEEEEDEEFTPPEPEAESDE
ncbi:MAG: tetratricopeptide repeat protein [Myxococcota bacterium]